MTTWSGTNADGLARGMRNTPRHFLGGFRMKVQGPGVAALSSRYGGCRPGEMADLGQVAAQHGQVMAVVEAAQPAQAVGGVLVVEPRHHRVAGIGGHRHQAPSPSHWAACLSRRGWDSRDEWIETEPWVYPNTPEGRAGKRGNAIWRACGPGENAFGRFARKRQCGRPPRERPRIGGRGTIGIGTIVLALVAMYFGVDPNVVLQMAEGRPRSNSRLRRSARRRTIRRPFRGQVLGETRTPGPRSSRTT